MPPSQEIGTDTRRKPSKAAMPKRKRHEEVAEHIELLVLSHRIGIGSRLPSERELMERFGVGRSTVREALFKLNRMGLVQLAPHARVSGAGSPLRSTDEERRDRRMVQSRDSG